MLRPLRLGIHSQQRHAASLLLTRTRPPGPGNSLKSNHLPEKKQEQGADRLRARPAQRLPLRPGRHHPSYAK